MIPVDGRAHRQMTIGEEVRDNRIEDSTLIFHVVADNAPGHINFTLMVSGKTVTGTACGYTRTTLKLKKLLM